MKHPILFACGLLLFLAGCMPPRNQVEIPHIQWLTIPAVELERETYSPVAGLDAERLGCRGALASLPICRVAIPNSEEDSAFRAESVRLAAHPDLRCRNLSAAMSRTLPNVRMYPLALVTEVQRIRYYGVGHSYRLDPQWQIRIARRVTELNPRPIEQKVRTFRHEAAHTIGATEERLLGWSAEEYADRCT